MKVQWGKRAERQFLEAIEYIKKDSEQNAEKVGRILLQIIDNLPNHPEQYGLEKYKLPNDGSYRYFIKYHYRISFRVQKNTVKIIRVRHQKRKPSSM
jgi:plasmid stabilization system protein ParE